MEQDPNKQSQDTNSQEETPEETSTTPNTPPAGSVDPTGTKPDQPANKPKNKKKLLIILAILVALLLAGGAAAMYFMKDNQEQPAATEEATEEPAEVVEYPLLESVIYLHADKANKAKGLFSRAVPSGDKSTIAATVANTTNTYPGNAQYAINDSSKYVMSAPVGSSSTIWFGSGATEPEVVYTAPAKKSVYSAVLNPDGTSIAFGLVANDATTSNAAPEIWTVGVEGGDATKIATLNSLKGKGAFPEAWDSENNKVFFRTGCIQCDGYDANVWSIAEGETSPTQVFKAPNGTVALTLKFNGDLSTMSYVKGAALSQAQIKQKGLPNLFGGTYPPYELHTVELASDKDNKVLSFGKEADVKGSDDFPQPDAGWVQTSEGSQLFYTFLDKYYATDTEGNYKFYVLADENDISNVLYASEREVIVDSKEGNGFNVYHYNIDKEAQTKLMEATYETVVLNFLTK